MTIFFIILYVKNLNHISNKSNLRLNLNYAWEVLYFMVILKIFLNSLVDICHNFAP